MQIVLIVQFRQSKPHEYIIIDVSVQNKNGNTETKDLLYRQIYVHIHPLM